MFAPLALAAQQSGPAAPVPAPILSAHKIFIANGGADAGSLLGRTFQHQPEKTYALFYASMQARGRWQLVNSPAGADLILVVRLVQAGPYATLGDGMAVELKIIDGNTHMPLWNLLQPLKDADLQGTWAKNYSSGVDALTDQFQALTSAAAPQN